MTEPTETLRHVLVAVSASILFCITLSGCAVPTRQEADPLPSTQTTPDNAGTSPVPPCTGKVPFGESMTMKRLAFRNLSIEVPDNPSWPTMTEGQAEDSASIFFGTPRWTDATSMGVTCNLVRDFTLSLEPEALTASDLRTQYGDSATVAEKKIGSVSAITVDEIDGVCPAPFIIFSAPETMRLSTSCEAAALLKHPMQKLEEMVRSLRTEQ